MLLGMLGLLGMGCAGEPESGPLWVDPGVLRLSPDRTRAQIEIHNRTGTPRPLSEVALRGPNWDSLRFVDETHPRTIDAHASVLLELEVSAASFQVEPGRYRSGNATLTFASNRHAYELPIEFRGSPPSPLRPLLLGAIALLGLAVGIVWRTGARPSQHAPGSARVLGAVTFASLLVAAMAIPVGFGACRGRLGELVGPRELGACREMILMPESPAIWWWIASLTIAGVTLTLLRAGRATGAELALAGLRSLGLTLILATLLFGLAPADASASALILVQAQMTELAGITLPRWGVLAQPLGAVLAFLLIASAGTTRRDQTPTPGIAALERLESWVWSAVLVTAFLGGPAIPWFSQRPIPLLPHGPSIALELAMFVLELVVINVLVDRMRAHLSKLELGPAQLVRLHAHWTIPIALLQLMAVLLW
jgi:hypothetical protein